MRMRMTLAMLVLAVLAAMASPGAAAPNAPDRPLTVATFNIHHGADPDENLSLSRIADVINDMSADIIGLQEVDRHWSGRSDWADQPAELADLLDMHVVYGANLDRDPPAPGEPRRQYGTAILSRYPILDWSNTPLPNLGGEQRGLLEALINVDGVPVRVLNTHLQHNSAAERAAQTEAIAQRIDELDEPVILLGDLNARPGTAEMRPLETRLDDAWLAGDGAGDGFTYSSENPYQRIDYVMVSRDITVDQVDVVQTMASDHLPVAAEVVLPGSRTGRGNDGSDTLPLARAHAHNDYEHERPLYDALANGFTSVEADVWLVDGELLVAHDREDVTTGRTLESLYLQPLRDVVKANGGSVYRGWDHSLQLLIDIKSDGEATYRALHRELEGYKSILTTFRNGRADERAVTAVISGNRPRHLMASQPVRFAAYDGRMSDLGSSAPATFIPLISDRWTAHFTWQGVGPMPDVERRKLEDIVNTAHANGQRVRFWATPETEGPREAVWSELVAAGVDYINTDHLAALRQWLQDNDPHPSKPEVDWFTD